MLRGRGEIEAERAPAQRHERKRAEPRQNDRELIVDERRRAEPEEATGRHDKTLRAARQPRQNAEGEGEQPAQEPGPHGHTHRIQAADRKACSGAQSRRGKGADQGAELCRHLRVAEDVRGGEGAGADERSLGERGHPREPDA